MLRLYGSDDLFPDNPRESHRPFESVNYVTCHDGFTLYDAVAYNEKRNWPNGHGNTDGTSENLSWNCGWEGDEEVPAAVMALRKRQAKTFSASCSWPTACRCSPPGDEFLRTQRGNNNPYNQDNETTWLDWSRKESACRSFSIREADDRIPQVSPDHRPRSSGATTFTGTGRAWRRPVHSIAQRRLLLARCIAGRLRPLRHDQRVPRAARL